VAAGRGKGTRRASGTGGRKAERRRAWLLVGGVLLILGGVVIGRWTMNPAPPRMPGEDGSPAERDDIAGDVATARPVPAESSGAPALPGSAAPDRPAPDLPASDRPVAPAHGEALVAVVIDDLGRSVDAVDRLAALGVDLTYAVLPFETRTAEVARRLAEHRAEILLHLPMEAGGDANPGPGALFRTMAPEELARRTREALAAVPGAVGANNHMGSALSADDGAMAPVLRVLEERGLFFLDSRTSAESVGYRLARRMGIPAAERQVFLDREIDVEEIRAQFRRLLSVAAESGAAIAIGHPYPETLLVLEEEVPAARASGFRFVPVSYLLERSGVEEGM
jgi:uncharacterized protein